MVRKQIHVVLSPYAAMGRNVLRGIAAYAPGRHDWQLNTLGAAQLRRGQTHSPDTADALIGRVSPAVADAWQGADRCRVVNVSRAMDVPGAANGTCDDGAIARMVAEYLLGKGLERFGWRGPSERGCAATTSRRRFGAAGTRCRSSSRVRTTTATISRCGSRGSTRHAG